MIEKPELHPITSDTVSYWFSDENWHDLQVDAKNALTNIKLLIPFDKVIDARFFPEFIINQEKLDYVHLLFVTKRILYHVYLGRGKVIHSEYPMVNISCRVEFNYSAEGKRISSVFLYFDIGEVKEDGKPHIHYFEAPPKIRAHAITLVALINQLKANEYGNSED